MQRRCAESGACCNRNDATGSACPQGAMQTKAVQRIKYDDMVVCVCVFVEEEEEEEDEKEDEGDEEPRRFGGVWIGMYVRVDRRF